MKELNLVKFVISSNSSLTILENEHLYAILDKELKLPKYQQFRHTLLPKVSASLKSALTIKLTNAVSISLIVDIWVNKMQSDFIAVGAALMNDSFEREIVILDMMRMTTNHTAEHVKECVENMINGFNFDKRKINCKFIILKKSMQ